MNDIPLEVVRKNTRTLTVTVTDNTGAIVDLTNYTMLCSVKRNAQDTDANAIIGPITGTIAAPATGIGIISLTADQTDVPAEDYIYDIQIATAANTDRQTIAGPSKFTIIENVNKG